MRIGGLLAVAILMISLPLRAADLVMSTENTPDHPQARFLEEFAAAVTPALHPHSLILKHSADAVRGRDEAEALTNGRIAFAAPGLWNLDSYNTDLNALLMPTLTGRSTAELEALVDGPLGAVLNAGLMRSLDVVVIGRWLDLGPAHIFTVSRPVRTFADLRGLRIRYAGGAANEMVLKALGAVPVLVPWPEVPAALRAGRVDGILTTASTVVSGRLWDAGLRHGFLSGQYYSFFIPMASRDVWRRLSPPQRDAVRAAWEAGIETGREAARSSQEQAGRTLQAAGLTLTVPDGADLTATRARLVALQPDFLSGLGVSAEVAAALSQAGLP
ncbi:TRAP transporter substrate-binding protein DctP [Novispirillum itersonii]|uniref:C4-dicarboxylate-binding protein DctP n=1 Tax=Novispirillum itersonii TaxID=189 RepID=A0A7W9ZC21_NOVIT|nr:TRAP transporter substrate-binding protein DctP [Novispirillum itersonii]MBB6208721.1 C4-dicarboxylate-binding protein DctP [Novispirillum itersonii]